MLELSTTNLSKNTSADSQGQNDVLLTKSRPVSFTIKGDEISGQSEKDDIIFESTKITASKNSISLKVHYMQKMQIKISLVAMKVLSQEQMMKN